MSTLYPDDGFTKFPNELRNAPWRNMPKVVAVYFYLRMKATHFPCGWNGIVLEPGQLITGRKAIAEDTGLTEQEVKTALKHLESTGYTTRKATNKFSVISFTDKENWVPYLEEPTSRISSNLNNKQTTSKQQANNNQPHKETIENKRQGEGGEDDAAAAAALDNVNALLRRYRLTDSEATLEALLEDANAYGFDVLEAALKEAANSNSRERVSVNFYRTFLNGSSKQAEAYDPYAGVPVLGKK